MKHVQVVLVSFVACLVAGCSLSAPAAANIKSPLWDGQSFAVTRGVSNFYSIPSDGYQVDEICGPYDVSIDSPPGVSTSSETGYLTAQARTFRFIASAGQGVDAGTRQGVIRGRNRCGNHFNTYFTFEIR